MMNEMILFGFLYINRILGFFPITCRVESSRVVKEGRTDSRLLFLNPPPVRFSSRFPRKAACSRVPLFHPISRSWFVVALMARDGY